VAYSLHFTQEKKAEFPISSSSLWREQTVVHRSYRQPDGENDDLERYGDVYVKEEQLTKKGEVLYVGAWDHFSSILTNSIVE
jgi:hypothetical protein